MGERADDKPVKGRAITFSDLMEIVSHPAFRIGFLDAQSGRGLDHDHISARIEAETPINSLKRLGWDAGLFGRRSVAVAQYRYEEGRLAVLQLGLRCRAWGHPDYPPKQVFDYIWDRSRPPEDGSK